MVLLTAFLIICLTLDLALHLILWGSIVEMMDKINAIAAALALQKSQQAALAQKLELTISELTLLVNAFGEALGVDSARTLTRPAPKPTSTSPKK